MRKLDIRGDTLVEVLIALAVIVLVIAGAYNSATRSLRVTRQAQERVEAVKLAENQIEQLKSLALFAIVPSQNIFIPTPYCIVDATNTVATLSGTPDPDLFMDTLADPPYSSNCRRSNNRFHVYIEYVAADNLFTVRVRWERLGGGRDQVVMVYRAYR